MDKLYMVCVRLTTRTVGGKKSRNKKEEVEEINGFFSDA